MTQDFDKFAARAAPAIFVLLWSTGFIGTKYVVNNADPLTYLAIRMALVVVLMAVICAIARPAWPNRVEIGHSIVAGILVHGDLSRRHGGRDLAVDSGRPVGADPGPAADPDVHHREPLARRARDRDAMGRTAARACRRCADPARPADGRAGRLGLDCVGDIAGQHHARHALPAALLQPHRLAQRQPRAICRGDRVLCDRRLPVRGARGALDHRIHSRAWPGSRWCCRSARSACCTG